MSHVGSFYDVVDFLNDDAIDCVAHLAALSLVGESVKNPADYYEVNVGAGLRLLHACLRAERTPKVIFASSAAVYGDAHLARIHEFAPTHPVNPYGETKLTFEKALSWYRRAGLNSISLRLFNVAGASEKNCERHEPETHLIPNIIRAVREDRPLVVFGDGCDARDYVHVLDVADAFVRAVECGESGPFNIGSGVGYTVREVIDTFQFVVGRSVKVQFDERRPGDPCSLVADLTRTNRVLGWTPRRPLGVMILDAWQHG